jgi:uncharacterized protein (TIGR03086 family)
MGRVADAEHTARADHRAVARDDVIKLIAAGRDREAAEHGAAVHLATDGGSMDPLQQFGALAPTLGTVVAGLTPEQLDTPTLATDFTVRGVLEHMIGGATVFAAAFRGEDAADPELGDPLASLGEALGDLVAAVSTPGALDRTIAAPFGDVPGETFARFVVLDGLVHGWDLATATGQPYEPPVELVAAVQAFADEALDPLRDGDTFAAAAEPPSGATPIEQLVATTGRRI